MSHELSIPAKPSLQTSPCQKGFILTPSPAANFGSKNHLQLQIREVWAVDSVRAN